jgi:hypothetical protein
MTGLPERIVDRIGAPERRGRKIDHMGKLDGGGLLPSKIGLRQVGFDTMFKIGLYRVDAVFVFLGGLGSGQKNTTRLDLLQRQIETIIWTLTASDSILNSLNTDECYHMRVMR